MKNGEKSIFSENKDVLTKNIRVLKIRYYPSGTPENKDVSTIFGCWNIFVLLWIYERENFEKYCWKIILNETD